jgi:hypothetical protein
MIAGGGAIVKIYLGAPHEYTAFPSKVAEEAAAMTIQSVREKLEGKIYS